MNDSDKTREQLIQELSALRQRNAELEQSLTACRQKEAQREASLRHLQLVIETLGKGITLSNESGSFEIFNGRMEEITGYTREEANRSGNFLSLLYPDPEAYGNALHGLADLIRDGRSRSTETTIQTKDGDARTLLVSTSLVQDQGTRWFLSVYHDIHEHKHATGKLAEYHEYLEELVKTRTIALEMSNTQLQQEIARHEETGKALLESREYARNIIESSLDMIIAVDTNRRITEFNKAARNHFGYSLEEILGQPIDILYAEPEQARTVQRQMVEEGQSIQEIVNRRKNGEIFPCLLSGSALLNTSGDIVGFMGISRDITEQKRTEEALRESEEKYRGLFENLHDVFYRADIMGNLTLVSPSVTRLLGYTLDEVDGLNLIRDIYTMTVEGRREFMKTINTKGYIEGVEVKLKRKDGQEIWVSSNSHLYKDNHGNVLGIEGIFRDITTRKEAEEQLLTAHHQLKETLDNLKRTQTQLLQSERMAALGQLVAGIAHEINTPAGAIVSAIHEIESSLYPAITRLARLQAELPQEIRQLYVNACRRTLLAGKRLSTRERRIMAQNIRATLQESGLSLPEKNSRQLAVIGLKEQDIREILPLFRSPQYEEIHESLYTLGMTWLHIKNIAASITVITQQINALKHYSHLDRGVLVETDVQQDLDNTLFILQHHLRSVTILKEYDPSLPSLLCSASQLNQVWTNLILNAVQAMQGEGTLTIRVSHSQTDIAVELEDSGPGIPADIVSRIFEPYFTTRSTDEKGIGMGLTICQQIVEQHQGQIEVVSSQPGRTCFRVRLPIILSNNTSFLH